MNTTVEAVRCRSILNYLSAMLTEGAREGTPASTEIIKLRINAMVYTMLTRVLIILVTPATNERLIQKANSFNNIDKVIVSKRV